MHGIHFVWLALSCSRYDEDIELEDAIHTAILTLKVWSYSLASSGFFLAVY